MDPADRRDSAPDNEPAVLNPGAVRRGAVSKMPVPPRPAIVDIVGAGHAQTRLEDVQCSGEMSMTFLDSPPSAALLVAVAEAARQPRD